VCHGHKIKILRACPAYPPATGGVEQHVLHGLVAEKGDGAWLYSKDETLAIRN